MYSDAEIPYNYYSRRVASETFSLIRKNNESIVDRFYGQLVTDAGASEFLSHEEIESRLKGSFRGWLDYTFDRDRVLADPKLFYDYQDNIGRVHSRVDISLHLINYAKVVLKSCLFELDLSETSNPTESTCYISDVIDYSVDTFNQSYLKEVIETTRHMQSLRVVASGHQLALDFERAKGEVTAWARDILWEVSKGMPIANKKVSEFNICHWLKYKGTFSIVDEGLGQSSLSACDNLLEAKAAINSQLGEKDSDSSKSVLNDLINVVMHTSDQVYEKLGEAIQIILESEERKDALTKTLSRRYLLTVAHREVVFAKHSNAPFCVLMIDIDDFKAVNDLYGHRAGDEVLENVAFSLMERVGPGDYIFRYGGEEFLAIITETDLEVASHIAGDIRLQVLELRSTASDKER
ncbi:MAG: GGDEF domain-containing protein [Gammaproteobacteria bacterium]|nr:GGDEF domain-containing protein [Gammaproteobacteria bacterium]